MCLNVVDGGWTDLTTIQAGRARFVLEDKWDLIPELDATDFASLEHCISLGVDLSIACAIGGQSYRKNTGQSRFSVFYTAIPSSHIKVLQLGRCLATMHRQKQLTIQDSTMSTRSIT